MSGIVRFLPLVTWPSMVRWYNHSRYAAPRITPVTAKTAQMRLASNAPCIIVNSPTNPFNSGRPAELSMAMAKMMANFGMTCASPPYSLISRVCRRS